MPHRARRRPGVSAPVAWLAVVLWMAVIFFLSSQPELGDNFGRFRFGLAKVGHVVVFSILGALVAQAMDTARIRRRVWWTVVFVALYAIVDEVHQSFVPGRGPMLTDVAIDTISGLAGAVAWSRLGRSFLAQRTREAWHAGRRPPPPPTTTSPADEARHPAVDGRLTDEAPR